MIWTVFGISLVMLLIGTVVFQVLNKRSSKEKARERNYKLISYMVLVFLMLFTIAYVQWLLFIFCSILIIIALFEVLRAGRANGKNPILGFIIAGSILYFFSLFIKSSQPDLILFVYFIVINFDGFSQVIGESFGKHKLVPRISPAKTIEGLGGGTIVALALSLLMIPYFTHGERWYQVLGFTLIIIASSVAGDILASAYKRYCGIKDYSNLIPGHGGVLDRFDSFFMAGAVVQLIQWVAG